MDTWIAFARGPLFRLSLVLCALGLVFRFGWAAYAVVQAWRRAGDRRVPRETVARATVSWLFPIRLLRSRPVYSAASLLFHVGVIAVPLFFAGHVALWQADLSIPWPVLSPLAADIAGLAAIVGLSVLLASRLRPNVAPAVNRPQDMAILVVLLALAVSGLLASHPTWSPVDGRAITLAHILLGDLALVLTPTTKIVHCVLFPLTQLTAEIGWHFPEASGRNVAIALAKENEKI